MFRVTTSGYLVECEFCGNEELVATVRLAKSALDFHECSSVVNKVSDYTLVEYGDTIGIITPTFTTRVSYFD